MTKASGKIRMVQYLSRRLLPLAAGIGLLIALMGPITYWIIEHRYLHHITKLYAEELSEKFRDFALETPTLWKYQTYRFNSLVEGFHPAIDVLGFCVLDETGAPIRGYEYKKGWDKHGRELTFLEDLNVTLGSAPIIFNNRRVGTVEVIISDARLQRACAFLFCFSALVGAALALLAYRFPVRVVRKMEGEIEELLSTVEQNEERYRSLVEESLVGVYIIVDGKFKYVNPKMSEIFGWSFEELIDKKGPVDLTFPDDWAIVDENLRKRLAGEITSIDYEFRGITKDKRVIFLEVFGCRFNYQGKPAVIGSLLDITKRKRAEEQIQILNEGLELEVEEKTQELLDAQEELVRKEKLATLGQLSGSVGHELRNPLGVMSNAIYFLKMVLTEADETTKEYLDIIKQEIETSQRIISDLLDFARTKPPQTKTITANELIGQSIGRCTIPCCVTLQCEVPETLPPLNIDPQQIGQVLQNLIANGIQAMPEGGALKISARRERGTRNEDEKQVRGTRFEERGNQDLNLEPRSSNPDPRSSNLEPRSPILDPRFSNPDPRSPILDPAFIEISVEDTGEGISEENMSKLFQPLFTTKAKGIGLGLVVCRNLVEANGGRIEVESRVKEGTTFTVMLPVRGE